MSDQVPTHIGELSTHRLDQAVDAVDAALRAAGAPQAALDEVAIIRLVTRVPRATPWYGVQVKPGDSSVTAGVLLRNAVYAYEKAGQPGEAARLAQLIEHGKRDYYEYLDRLLEPAEAQRLDAARADRMAFEARMARDYFRQQRP